MLYHSKNLVLLVQAENSVCALSLQQVAEIMRPLPIHSLAEVPSFMRGLSKIRGEV